MDNIKIGSFLQALRKAKGMTQNEIGEYFSISSKAVSKWECGDSLPEIPMLKALAEFYDVTVDEILNGQRREVSNNLLDKNRKDMSEYFINKHYSRLNLWFLIAAFLLVLAFVMIYALGYTIARRDITCWVSVVISLISLFCNFFGLYLSGTMTKDLDVRVRTKYLIRKILYSFNHIMALIFVINAAFFFYTGINIEQMNVHLEIGYYSGEIFNVFNIFVFADICIQGIALGIINLFKNYKDYVKNYHYYLYFIFLGYIFLDIIFLLFTGKEEELAFILSGSLLFIVSVILAIIFYIKKKNNLLSYLFLAVASILLGLVHPLSMSSSNTPLMLQMSFILILIVIISDIIYLIKNKHEDKNYE